MLRVAVIGGGVTGLAAAYELEAQAARDGGRPVEVTLLESGDRLGGKVRTDRAQGFFLERGPDALFLRTPSTLDLLQAVGLGTEVVRANWAHRQSYLVNGRSLRSLPPGMEVGVPRALWPLVSTPLLTPLGKLRAALEVALPRRSSADDESVDGFIRRRFGGEVAERIASPLLGTIYNTDTERLSLAVALPHLREAERRHGSLLRAAWQAKAPGNRRPPVQSRESPFISFRRGLASLPNALCAQLTRTRVRQGVRVRSITPRHAGHTTQFIVAAATGERLAVDRVILATPAYESARMLDAALPSAAEPLAEIQYRSAVIVVLAFPRQAGATLPPGSGCLVPPGTPYRFIACSWTSRKWPHCAPGGELIVRCHLHADRFPGLLSADDAALVESVRADLRDLLGVEGYPLLSRVYRWPRAMPAYEVGHLARIDRVSQALGEAPGLVLAGAAYRGAGIPECLRQGMEAASRVIDGQPS